MTVVSYESNKISKLVNPVLFAKEDAAILDNNIQPLHFSLAELI